MIHLHSIPKQKTPVSPIMLLREVTVRRANRPGMAILWF